MLQLIKTKEDVEAFFLCLKQEGLVFHPDTPMQDYVKADGVPLYSKRDAELREDMLVRCFQVCLCEGVDIYYLASEVFADVEQELINQMEARWEARKYVEG